MESLGRTAISALKTALDRQPLTEAKVSFAWAIAAGPALARAGRVSWSDGLLRVTASSRAWQQELERARPVILQRVAHLIGPEAVKRITVTGPG